jgi:His/Glu/Gln/Arg/opine family amino acid ABC transporter permease subunit
MGSLDDIIKFLPAMLSGAKENLILTFPIMGVALAVGLLIALARMSQHQFLRWPAYSYTEFIRSTPTLVHIYFVFYVLPYLGMRFTPYLAAIAALGLNYAAYVSEIYRSGIQGVGPGQWDAALSIGMSRKTALRRIILPQAFRIMLPPMTGSFLTCLQDTSMLSLITIRDILWMSFTLSDLTFKHVTIFSMAMVIYFAMSYPIALSVRYLEKRLQLP